MEGEREGGREGGGREGGRERGKKGSGDRRETTEKEREREFTDTWRGKRETHSCIYHIPKIEVTGQVHILKNLQIPENKEKPINIHHTPGMLHCTAKFCTYLPSSGLLGFEAVYVMG